MSRIAIVVATFPPYRGGQGNVAAAHARLLAASGHEVTVYATLHPQRESVTVPITLRSTANGSNPQEKNRLGVTGYAPAVRPAAGAPYRSVPLPTLLRYGNAGFAPSVARAVAGADVVFLHYPFFGGLEPFALAARRPGQRLIVYYHFDPVGRGLWRLVFALHRRIFLARLLSRTDTVLVSSFGYAETSYLRPFLGTPGNHLQVVPIPVDLTRFSPGEKPADLCASHSLNPDTPIVLFVGGLDQAHYFKGVRVLLEAWQRIVARLPAARLFIIGDGGERASYEALSRRLGIADQMKFLGSVSEDLLPRYYRLADVVVSPSIDRSEAFGLVILEAMASARAVVASRLPGVASVVRGGETGLLVPPGDARALAAALVALLNDRAKLRRFGERGRAVAEGEYSERRVAALLERTLTTA